MRCNVMPAPKARGARPWERPRQMRASRVQLALGARFWVPYRTLSARLALPALGQVPKGRPPCQAATVVPVALTVKMWVQQAQVCAGSALLARGVAWLEPNRSLLARHAHRELGAAQLELPVSPHACAVQQALGVQQSKPAPPVHAMHVVWVSTSQRPDRLPKTIALSAGKALTTAGSALLRVQSAPREAGVSLLERHLATSAPMELGHTLKARCMQRIAHPADMRTIARRVRRLASRCRSQALISMAFRASSRRLLRVLLLRTSLPHAASPAILLFGMRK